MSPLADLPLCHRGDMGASTSASNRRAACLRSLVGFLKACCAREEMQGVAGAEACETKSEAIRKFGSLESECPVTPTIMTDTQLFQFLQARYAAGRLQRPHWGPPVWSQQRSRRSTTQLGLRTRVTGAVVAVDHSHMEEPKHVTPNPVSTVTVQTIIGHRG